MKSSFLLTVFAYFFFPAFSQSEDQTSTFLETHTKDRQYYVQSTDAYVIVYEVRTIWDKGGSWSMVIADTPASAGTNYNGKNFDVIREGGDIYLVTGKKAGGKHHLIAVPDVGKMNASLNNAYFFEQFFRMQNDINDRYPLNHYSYRSGSGLWRNLTNQEASPAEFREFASDLLRAIKDSLISVNEKYTSVTNGLLASLGTITYQELKDGLSELPPDFVSVSKYFTNIAREVSKQRPEDFFRLAEDMPENKSVIFYAADDSKTSVRTLKAVKGHDGVKEEFFKERRFSKTMPWKLLGLYGGLAGIVAIVIASN